MLDVVIDVIEAFVSEGIERIIKFFLKNAPRRTKKK
jgi:hypothetical protein